jgi:hypothetical protein
MAGESRAAAVRSRKQMHELNRTVKKHDTIMRIKQLMNERAQTNEDYEPGISNQQCRYTSKEGSTETKNKFKMMRKAVTPSC